MSDGWARLPAGSRLAMFDSTPNTIEPPSCGVPDWSGWLNPEAAPPSVPPGPEVVVPPASLLPLSPPPPHAAAISAKTIKRTDRKDSFRCPRRFDTVAPPDGVVNEQSRGTAV